MHYARNISPCAGLRKPIRDANPRAEQNDTRNNKISRQIDIITIGFRTPRFNVEVMADIRYDRGYINSYKGGRGTNGQAGVQPKKITYCSANKHAETEQKSLAGLMFLVVVGRVQAEWRKEQLEEFKELAHF